MESGEILATFVHSKTTDSNQVEMRFSGNIAARIDAKNRVFLPAAFRREMEARQAAGLNQGQEELPPLQLYLRRDDYQDCLLIYPAEVWEEEMARVRARLDRWDPLEQDLFRSFVMHTESVELDAQGRLLIPRSLREEVGLGSAVKFLGLDDRIELWPAEALDKPRIAPDDYRRMLQEKMTGKSQL